MKVIQLELDLQLDQVESQITQLLTQNETNWKEVAKLAITTQTEELYKEKFNSFTAWVNHIAQKSHRQPSLIWRYIKASRYYLQQIKSTDLEQIEEIKAAPEALERLEKVERQAPAEVFEKLKEKVLNGSATVAECRQVEQDYRPLEAKTNRGRPLKGEEGTYQHLGSLHDDSQVNPGQIVRNQIAPTIVRSLKSQFNLVDWISKSVGRRQPPRYCKDHSEVRITSDGQRRRLDFVAVARWTFKRPKDLFIVEVKSCLQDFLRDEKWSDYLDFCHYFCFACPANDAELIEAIASLTPDFVGIIGVDLTAEIQADLSYPVSVIRLPVRQEGIMVTSLFETLYERVLGWSASDDDGNLDDDENEGGNNNKDESIIYEEKALALSNIQPTAAQDQEAQDQEIFDLKQKIFYLEEKLGITHAEDDFNIKHINKTANTLLKEWGESNQYMWKPEIVKLFKLKRGLFPKAPKHSKNNLVLKQIMAAEELGIIKEIPVPDNIYAVGTVPLHLIFKRTAYYQPRGKLTQEEINLIYQHTLLTKNQICELLGITDYLFDKLKKKLEIEWADKGLSSASKHLYNLYSFTDVLKIKNEGERHSSLKLKN